MMRTRSIVAAAAALVCCGVLVGCGPSVEERKAMAAFNALDDLAQRGGHVKKLDRFEQRPDKVFMIEAEIVNDEGLAIGRLRSERVEGFATMRPRIQWYETPGVSEEWQMPEGRRRGGPRGQGGGPRQQGQRGPQGRDGAAETPPQESQDTPPE